MADDELNRARKAQQQFEQSMNEWVAARADTVLDMPATVVAEYVLVARHRGFDSDGDPYGFTMIHDPLGQETWVSEGLVKRAWRGLRAEVEDEFVADYDEDDD